MNPSRIKHAGFALLSGVLLASATVATASTPKIQTGSAAEVTFDGLHRIDNAVMAMAWVKPDIDLSRYNKILLMPAGMTFKEVKRSHGEFPLTQKQKENLRDTIETVFADELGKSRRFTLTNEPGPDVLQIQGALIDVTSHVPPQSVGRGGAILTNLGEATLVVELRDSVTEEILARAVDRRSVSPAFLQKSNSVNNLAEVRRTARVWAEQMRKRLDQFTTL